VRHGATHLGRARGQGRRRPHRRRTANARGVSPRERRDHPRRVLPHPQRSAGASRRRRRGRVVGGVGDPDPVSFDGRRGTPRSVCWCRLESEG
jgi:hypothetical protein